jgi:hypothetical protein
MKNTPFNRLKKLGLIDYTTETKLSKGQRSWVTRQAREHEYIINNFDSFKAVKVKKENVKAFKDSGFVTTKTSKVIIAKNGFDKVKVKNRDIYFEGVHAVSGKTIKENVKVTESKNFVDKLKELSGVKLKRNQVVTVKIGNNGAFNIAYKSWEDLLAYIQNTFNPVHNKTPLSKRKKQHLIQMMSIVTVEGKRNSSVKKSRNTKWLSKRGK